MSKFVYHNNGKITRLDMNGIPIMSSKGVSSLSAQSDGNYIIMKTGDTYSFAPTTAGLTAVTPQNLTNVTADNKHYLLAIGSDNNFTQILFNNNSINNTFSYTNGSWVLDKKGLFEQYAESQDDAVNMFALPIINNNKETHLITPNTAEIGQYCFKVKDVEGNPTLEKMSISPTDINYTKVDSNAHIVYVDTNDNFQSIVIPYGKTWFNSISNKNGTWTFDQMSIYRQCNASTTIKGFGLAVIDSNTSNKIVTLNTAETGDYIFSYTSGSTAPTLKKATYISEVTPNTLYNSNPPTTDSLMVVSNEGFKYLTTPETAASYLINFDGQNLNYKRLYSPRFTRYSVDTGRDYELPASGTTNVQDIFQDLSGLQIENNSLIHFKIFFYLEDTAQQENTIGSFTIRRKTSSTESEELSTHYIYSPVDNLVTATFTFPYSGNMSSMSLVTSLQTGVKILGGMKHELLVETQLRL